MNIGIFTNAYKPIISGVVNSIDLIKKGMEKLGHKVYIFAPKFDKYEDEEPNVYRFKSLSLSDKIQYPLPFPLSIRLGKVIKSLKLDIVHSHHPFLLGSLGVWTAKKRNIPVVFTFHTQYEQYSHYVPFHQGIVKKVTRFLVYNYSKDCNLIISPSSTILSLIRSYKIKTPVKMLHNAVDLSQFKNTNPKAVKEKYGIKDDEKILIYVGRIGKEKNLKFMIDSFKEALNEVSKAKLMIVGEGSEVEPLKKYCSQINIYDRVIFPGRVEYDMVPDYYSAGYAFVMTSTTEVKPLALLEAMASGLPIVAVSAAGSSDTVTNEYDGLLTNLNKEQYVKALIRILKDDNLRNRLSKASLKTSDGYSMENTSKIIESVYIDLIKSKLKERWH